MIYISFVSDMYIIYIIRTMIYPNINDKTLRSKTQKILVSQLLIQKKLAIATANLCLPDLK